MLITVSLVEDNHGTRNAVVELINRAQNLRCLNAYDSGEAGLAGILAEKPDVALVDIHLPGMNGIELIAKLKLNAPKLSFLVLTNYGESSLIFDALRAGASGYLLKKSIPAELIPAIELVHGGGGSSAVRCRRCQDGLGITCFGLDADRAGIRQVFHADGRCEAGSKPSVGH